jgi:hypothetical protein
MPIPGLTDIYEFSDWIKKEYPKAKSTLQINSEVGGLILVSLIQPTIQNTLLNKTEGWDG